MVKIGVFGDTHIPDRADKIPEEIKKTLYECDLILCTGDLTGEEVVDFIKASGKKYKIVRGNMDRLDLSRMASIDIEGKRIVVTHGDEIKPRGDKDRLLELAKRYDADVLAYGHTHTQDAWESDGIMFVNPGSATGVSRNFDDKPHCAIVEIKAGKINVKQV